MQVIRAQRYFLAKLLVNIKADILENPALLTSETAPRLDQAVAACECVTRPVPADGNPWSNDGQPFFISGTDLARSVREAIRSSQVSLFTNIPLQAPDCEWK